MHVQGETALMEVAQYLHCLPMAEYLISQGADVNARSSVRSQAESPTCMLAQNHLPANAHAFRAQDGSTPLMQELKSYDTRLAMAELLIQHGADINARDNVRTSFAALVCHQQMRLAAHVLQFGLPVRANTTDVGCSRSARAQGWVPGGARSRP